MLQNEYLLAEVGAGLLLPIGNNLPNLNQNTIKFAKIADWFRLRAPRRTLQSISSPTGQLLAADFRRFHKLKL